MKNTKRHKASFIAWIMVILVLAIAIPLNLIASRLDVSWDMTPSKLYSLTDTSTEYLEELSDEGVTVDFYFLMKMDVLKTDTEYLALYNTLLQYSSYSCINFKDFDPDEEPELVDSLNPDGYLNLTSGDILIQCNGISKRLPSSSMYRYNYDSDGNVESAYFQGENYITGAIKAAASNFTPTLYFLTGHGEQSLEDNYTQLIANLSNYNYAAKTLDLSQETAVPDDAAILVEAAPTEDITDAEKEMIDDYLDKGGNITFLMSPVKDNIKFSNIEDIMAEFCIAMDYDRVYETDSSLHADGDAYTIMCNLTEVSDDEDTTDDEYSEYIDITAVNTSTDSSIDLTSGLIDNGFDTYMPESRSFYEVYTENFSTMSLNTLITANTTAVGEPYGGINDDPDDITNEVNGLTLAMYSMDNSRNEAKIVCFGSADFITDDSLEDGYFVNPVYLLLSTVSWMYDSDVDMGIENKENTYDTMNFSGASQADGIMILFVAVPVVIAVIGLTVWIRRRKA
jgi:hypothetical protein